MSLDLIVHFVCSGWFFRTWYPDAHQFISLRTLFWVQLHCSDSSTFWLCILPWAYVFLAGDRHIFLPFVALCVFAWGCACRKTRGGWYFLLPFFYNVSLQMAGYRHSPLNTLWNCSAAVRKTLLNLISDCFCSLCPKPGFPEWKNTECKAPIAYRPRKENPFSAAARCSGPAAKVTAHGCCSTGLPAALFSVVHLGLCLGRQGKASANELREKMCGTGSTKWRYKRSLLSKGTKCPISPGNACLLRLVSPCPNFYCSALHLC